MTERSPIAIFIYNRPDKVKSLLDSLSLNSGFENYEYYIFSDGPKNESELPDVIKSRKIVKDFFTKIKYELVSKEKNYGLSNSIINGVNFTLNKHERVIVLEDDLIVSKDFLNYMEVSLKRYFKQKKVYSISGHVFNSDVMNSFNSLFFLKHISSWGWGTWRDRWTSFNKFLDKNHSLKINKENKKSFNLDNTYPFSKILEKTNKGMVDSWAIKWYYYIYINEGLSLYPYTTLINNKGFDGSGSNTLSNYNEEIKSNSIELNFPDKVELNELAYDEYKKQIKKKLNPHILKKIFFRIKKSFK